MVFCSKCGNELPVEGNFCNKCGNQINVLLREGNQLWYLAPIFFSIIGGVIAYYAVKDYDRKLAVNCLKIGIILSTIGITLMILSAITR